ncbi:MAG: class II aldolase/adducin family protein [Candidatus Margulisiibacteriota bacterium]
MAILSKGKVNVFVPRYNGLGGVPLSMIRDARAQICDVLRKCINNDLVAVGGLHVGMGANNSIRIGTSNVVAIKGSGFDSGSIIPKNCPVMNLSTGKVIEMPGEDPVRPSCEYITHLAAYRANPNIGAILHTHPPIATAFASAGVKMWPITPDFVAVLKESGFLPAIEYTFPASKDLATAVTQALINEQGIHTVVLMANHGVLCTGANLLEAYRRVQLVEDSANTIRTILELTRFSPNSAALLSTGVGGRPNYALSAERCADLLDSGFEKFRQQLSAGTACTVAVSKDTIKSRQPVGINYAAVLKAPGKMEIEELEYPTCGEDEIIARVNLAAVCGSDLRLWKGTKAAVAGPILHEGIVEIVEVGKKEKGYKPGDRVTLAAFNPRDHAAHFGYNGEGYSATYIKIRPEHIEDGRVIKIPHCLSDMDAIMTEAISCVLRGQNVVMSYSGKPVNKFQDGRVVIIGAGPIGIMHAELARANGAKQVIIVDIDPERIELAKQKGIEAEFIQIERGASPEEQIRQLTEGHLADVVITAASDPNAAVPTFKYVADNGVIMFFAGVQKGDKIDLSGQGFAMQQFVGDGGLLDLQGDDANAIDLYDIHYTDKAYRLTRGERSFDVVGSTASSPDDFREVLDWIVKGKIDPHKFMTHVVTLDELPQVLEEACNGKCRGESSYKIVVDMGEPFSAVDLSK